MRTETYNFRTRPPYTPEGSPEKPAKRQKMGTLSGRTISPANKEEDHNKDAFKDYALYVKADMLERKLAKGTLNGE